MALVEVSNYMFTLQIKNQKEKIANDTSTAHKCDCHESVHLSRKNGFYICTVAVIYRFDLPYYFVRSAVDRKKKTIFPSHLDLLQTRLFLRHNCL